MKYEMVEMMSNKNLSTPHLNPGLIKGKRRFGELEDHRKPAA